MKLYSLDFCSLRSVSGLCLTVSNNRQLWLKVFGLVRLGFCFLVSKSTILFQMATIANIRCYTLVRHSRVRTSDMPLSGVFSNGCSILLVLLQFLLPSKCPFLGTKLVFDEVLSS